MKKLSPVSVFLYCIPFILIPANGRSQGNHPGHKCPNFFVVDGEDPGQGWDKVPTTQVGSVCRLDQDVNGLVKTFRLPSGLTLDCQGHALTPHVTGKSGDSSSRSIPELAIFMNHVERSGVKNCVINDFDHGILGANSQAEESSPEQRNVIEGNQIIARFVAIHLVEADNFDIKGNKPVIWQTRGGAGILIHHDSDWVEIRDNEIHGDFSASTQGAVLMPGPTLDPGSNPLRMSGSGAILALQVLSAHPSLFSAVINGDLYQFRASDSGEVDASFTEDTLVEGNTITFKADNTLEDGIVASNTIGTVVRDNTIGKEDGTSSVRQAIRAGGNSGFDQKLPSSCLGKPERSCLSDLDCNIPGFDVGEPDTCAAPVPIKFVVWLPRDLIYEDNKIYGPFVTAMNAVGNIIIQGNLVNGNNKLPINVSENYGIGLAGKNAIEDAVVTGNQVFGVRNAIRLINTFAAAPAFLGVKFSLNDITGYARSAVDISNDYSLKSELSVDGQGNVCAPEASDCQGNYWGPNGFDPTLVKRTNGAVQPLNPPLVVDSHAFLEPIFPDE